MLWKFKIQKFLSGGPSQLFWELFDEVPEVPGNSKTSKFRQKLENLKISTKCIDDLLETKLGIDNLETWAVKSEFLLLIVD